MMSSDPGNKFIGCIVSIRTHPKANGAVGHITGTVCAIGKTEHSLTLNNGVLNGLALPDEYTIMADEIACLELITAVADDADTEDVRPVNDEANKRSQKVVVEEQSVPEVTSSVNNMSVSDSQPQYKNFMEFAIGIGGGGNVPIFNAKSGQTNNGSVSAGGDQQNNKKKSDSNGPQIVYSATAFENSYKPDKSQRKSAFNAYPSNNLNQSGILPGSQEFTPTQNIILSKLGLSSQVASPPQNTRVQRNDRNSKAVPIPNKVQNGYQQGSQARSPRVKGGPLLLRPQDTFEMTTAEIKAHEFDFEENLAKFDKLPVGNVPKPVPVAKTPKFKSSDTTLQANRSIESVTLVNMKASKLFTTDTGIVIPAVEVNIRNTILNVAHNYGLTHSITVEVFGRAVAQICLPLLGDAYRLSPERIKDRPAVLVCTGPHWQGAAGICAARILGSLGVETVLYAPKEEKMLCEKEETLYRFSGNMLSRTLKTITQRKYDLVILAMDDQQNTSFSFDPSLLPLQGTEIVLVDPPLVESYGKALASTPSRMGAGIGQNKLVIVSPLLPLAYRTGPKLKMYLVNMGVPADIYKMSGVNYKSPFGDKLVVQFFSNKHEEE